jgi:transposase
MPWKECHVMDERVRFVARLLEGEKMAVLCQEFGISRKTGYKIYDRYKDTGVRGLSDRSGGRTDTPTNSRWRSKRRSFG